MSSPSKDLEIFNKLSKDQIIQLANLFDEKIISTTPNQSKIEEIIGKNFTETEITTIITVFYNFFLHADDPEILKQTIADTKLNDEIKSATTQALSIVIEKTDEEKIEIEFESSYLEDFGHSHIHELAIYAEFRPIFKHGEIVKMVPALVFQGMTHNPNWENINEKEINFQCSVIYAEKLVKNMQKNIDEIKAQIEVLQKKFGDSIVD